MRFYNTWLSIRDQGIIKIHIDWLSIRDEGNMKTYIAWLPIRDQGIIKIHIDWLPIRDIFRKIIQKYNICGIWRDLGVKQGCWVGTQQSFGEGNTRFYNAWPPCIIEKYNTWPPCIIKSHNARVSIKGFSSFFLLALQQVSLKKSLGLRRMLVYDAREVVGSVIICSRPKIVRMCTLLCLWFHNTVIRTD